MKPLTKFVGYELTGIIFILIHRRRLREWAYHLQVVPLHSFVALTGQFLEAHSIDDLDDAASIDDRAGFVEPLQFKCDRRPMNAKRIGDGLLRQAEMLALSASAQHQEPAGETTANMMQTVTRSQTGDLDESRPGAAIERIPNHRILLTGLSDGLGRNTPARSTDLDDA